jgi:hypothetical protein
MSVDWDFPALTTFIFNERGKHKEWQGAVGEQSVLEGPHLADLYYPATNITLVDTGFAGSGQSEKTGKAQKSKRNETCGNEGDGIAFQCRVYRGLVKPLPEGGKGDDHHGKAEPGADGKDRAL